MQVNRDIDRRLLDRGTKFIDAIVAPGSTVWKLIKAQFFPVGTGIGESGGRHHVYVEAIDEKGLPTAGIVFNYLWPGKVVPLITNGKTGFDAGNQPFSEGRNAFTVSKDDGDTVQGIGMGQDMPGGWNSGIHTSTLLRYQRMVEKDSGNVTPPVIPPTQPGKTIIEVITLYSDNTYERSNG